MEKEKQFEVRDNRRKEMFRVDDEYLNGYARLCGTNATLVYLCLCRHADRHQESFPSIETMATKTGVSKRSVIRGISTLVEWNIISKERERKENAKWLNNRYTLLDKSVWKSKPSATQSHGSQVPIKTEPSANDDQSQVPQVHTKVTHKKDTHIKDSKQSLQVKEEDSKSKEIQEILYLFQKEVNPIVKRMYGNTSQRKACLELIEAYGFEEVMQVIKLLPSINKKEFWPTATTPNQLLYKYQQIKDKLLGHKERALENRNNLV